MDVRLRVIIEEDHKIKTFRGFYTRIDGSGKSGVFRETDELYLRELLPDFFKTAIGRSVIDDNNFVRRSCLSSHSVKTCAVKFDTIVIRYHN